MKKLTGAILVVIVVLIVIMVIGVGFLLNKQNETSNQIAELKNQITSYTDSSTHNMQNTENNEEKQSVNENPTNQAINSVTNNKVDTSNMVTDLCDKSASYNGITYKFRLPYINATSDGAKAINSKIEKLKKEVEKTEQNIRNHNNGTDTTSFIDYVNYDYEYFMENEILTIIVKREFTEGDYSKFYIAYSLDTKNGTELKNEDLFDIAGQDIAQYSSKMKVYAQKYPDPTSGTNRISYISEDNFDVNKCTFYLKNGHLIALVSVSGTDYYGTYKIDMTNGDRVN